MKRNPFERYFSPEDHLQHQVIMFCKFQYPNLKYHHSPDAGRRTAFERYKYSYLGSDAGYPDLTFPTILLAIELKIKPNKPTEAQLQWLEYLRSNGWTAEVCYTFQEATQLIIKTVKNHE